MQSFWLLDQPSVRRVALVNGDVLSRKISRKDRNSFPLAGDAASISIIERRLGAGPIYANLKTDGARHDALMIPAGGMRLPPSPETAVLEDAGDNNFRAKDNLHMDGSEVFNFVMADVPPLIESLLQTAGIERDAVDWWLFHQPNRFMLQKLAEKLRVPPERMPSNVVEHYGNSSGVTIPAAIALNLATAVTQQAFYVCLSGFGVGLTWSSMLMPLGPLRFCKTILFPE